MINKKYLKLIRSKGWSEKNNFIYNLISTRIIDSIDLLNISSTEILEIGINENKTIKYLQNRFNNSNLTRADICNTNFTKATKMNYLNIDLSELKLKNNYYDLVYSNFFLHLSNNLEVNLRNIFDGLKSNGFFIAVIPAVDNVYQLVNTMYETDLKLYNGAHRRTNPSIGINEVFTILKNLNFDAPSINSDNITIDYSNFRKLLIDIKSMNLSYCYNDKKKFFEKKNYFKILEQFYRKNYYDKSFLLDIKLSIISAWKK